MTFFLKSFISNWTFAILNNFVFKVNWFWGSVYPFPHPSTESSTLPLHSWSLFLLCFVFFFFDIKISLCSSNWPGICNIVLAGIQLSILLPQPHKNWHYSHTPPHLKAVLLDICTRVFLCHFYLNLRIDWSM